GRVELAAVHGSVGVFEVVREVEGEHVDGEHTGLARAQGGERLLVRVVAVGGEDDEAFDTGFLPGSEQIVHPAVQRLAAHGSVAGEGPLGGGVDPIFDCRGAEDLERPGQVVGQALDDDGVATKREVRAVLLARSHRYEEAGIALKNETHLVGDEGLEVQRRAHVALAGCAAAIAAAEWLHGSAAAWAWAAGGARHDGRALAPPGRVRARAGRRAVRLANAGRGAWRRDPRPQRRGRRLGGPPPIRSRAGHRGAARRHHTILRVARGPAPDAGRRERGGDRAARCGPGGAGSGSRGERAVRGRLRGGAAVLYARSRAARTGRVRLLPDLLRARRHPVQRPAGAAVAGRREARRAARRDAARGRGARGGPRAARPGRAGGA